MMFTGRPITAAAIQDNNSSVVVKVWDKDFAAVQIGELLEVVGEQSTQTIHVNGFPRSEILITAKQVRLLKPSGSQIVQWIADHPDVKGIGYVKAQRLWDELGEDLYSALDRRDIETLSRVLRNADAIGSLLDAWSKDGNAELLRWMQQHRLPLSLGRKVIRVHGTKTLDNLRSDPYRLLSFSASWTLVDDIARNALGVPHDDDRRLRAAVEQALYDQLDNGNTAAPRTGLAGAVRKLIGAGIPLERAFAAAASNRSIKIHADAMQTAGAWLMEMTVAEFISSRLACPHQYPLFGNGIDSILSAFERGEAVRTGVPGFQLNDEQRAAVKRSAVHAFSVITGGAGVGKTTVLKSLYAVLDCTGRPRFQMALSGRAAKRMKEATGERAYTIAAFIKSVSTEDMGPEPTIVIDEASMVDLATMYRVIRKLPAKTQLILVGDPYQLPPIGAGLVLHCLTGIDDVPVSEIRSVKRQAVTSRIPAFASNVRSGTWEPSPGGLGADVQVIPCPNDRIMETVLRLYEQQPERTQILSATRANPFSGCKAINFACCMRYTAGKNARPLVVNDEPTGFYEGDLLLYTRNDWQRDLQNGLLGTLDEVFDEPRQMKHDEDSPEIEVLAWVNWEGRRVPLVESDLEWLEHGYAISIHKSQGSQFPRVVVPVTKTRSSLLDRTLIYTAVTRAQEQVILVGDVAAMKQAVTAPPTAHKRMVGLPSILKQRLLREDD